MYIILLKKDFNSKIKNILNSLQSKKINILKIACKLFTFPNISLWVYIL